MFSEELCRDTLVIESSPPKFRISSKAKTALFYVLLALIALGILYLIVALICGGFILKKRCLK
jgi:hypothetical protein